MSLAAVRDAYATRSAEYIELLGSIEDAADQDREYILAWAQRSTVGSSMSAAVQGRPHGAIIAQRT